MPEEYVPRGIELERLAVFAELRLAMAEQEEAEKRLKPSLAAPGYYYASYNSWASSWWSSSLLSYDWSCSPSSSWPPPPSSSWPSTMSIPREEEEATDDAGYYCSISAPSSTGLSFSDVFTFTPIPSDVPFSNATPPPPPLSYHPPSSPPSVNTTTAPPFTLTKAAQGFQKDWLNLLELGAQPTGCWKDAQTVYPQHKMDTYFLPRNAFFYMSESYSKEEAEKGEKFDWRELIDNGGESATF
ncbi:hypothetical protein GGR52DRAFT_570716 [Hypoxylon sp. FL1284]|nr:hypothetical protein GGR52DRAFT_570716 [Hypoxylon sp. FL1284]